MERIHRGLQGIALKRSAQYKIPEKDAESQRPKDNNHQLQAHIKLQLTKRRKH